MRKRRRSNQHSAVSTLSAGPLGCADATRQFWSKLCEMRYVESIDALATYFPSTLYVQGVVNAASYPATSSAVLDCLFILLCRERNNREIRQNVIAKHLPSFARIDGRSER